MRRHSCLAIRPRNAGTDGGRGPDLGLASFFGARSGRNVPWINFSAVGLGLGPRLPIPTADLRPQRRASPLRLSGAGAAARTVENLTACVLSRPRGRGGWDL